MAEHMNSYKQNSALTDPSSTAPDTPLAQSTTATERPAVENVAPLFSDNPQGVSQPGMQQQQNESPQAGSNGALPSGAGPRAGEAAGGKQSNGALVNGLDPGSMGGVEVGFYKLLLNPMMEEMRSTVNQNNEILEDLLKKMADERELNRKRQQSAHIPVILQGRGRDLQETIQHMENFIAYENYDVEDQSDVKLIPSSLRALDRCAELAVLGHGVGAYVSTLDGHHLKHIANRIVTDVTVWLTGIFRMPGASAHMHEEEREGLSRITHLAFHRKFAKYATDGYEALYPRPPVIYVSAAAKHNLGQHLCHQLGLPLSAVCTVPCEAGRMDISALQKLVEDDISSGKTPTLVISFAGTPLLGRVDDLNRLTELCKQHDLWLHLEGSSLTLLGGAPTLPGYLSAAPQANSITLNVGAWLALPAVPFTTLFRSPDVMMARAASLSTFNVRYRLNCVSLWMCLLQLGQEGIVARLQYHTHVAAMLHSRISKIPTTNQLILLEVEGPCVILRYQRLPANQPASSPSFPSNATSNGSAAVGHAGSDSPGAVPSDKAGGLATAIGGAAYSAERDPYFDTLNIWLVETLRREAPGIHVSAVELDRVGLCIRYSPLETSYTLAQCSVFETCVADVDQFSVCLARNVEILDATVGMRRAFEEIVSSQDNMRVIHLPTWAGLGAVQYVPDIWLKDLSQLPENGKNEINVLNHQMVNQLKSTDTAFSLGQSESGLYCVRFGLVTEDTDLEELIAMVYTAGKDVEESSKFIEMMSDVVRQGIEQAHLDLLKENQDKLLHEGVLRQVPLVGSLINWWSPPPKDPIKGRTFNLASGKIVSTEDTYKYHIQVQEGGSPPSPAGVMPGGTPRGRDGPLKANLKPTRARQEPLAASGGDPAPGGAEEAGGVEHAEGEAGGKEGEEEVKPEGERGEQIPLVQAAS